MKTKEIIENIKKEKKWLLLGNLFFLVFIAYVGMWINGSMEALDVMGREIFVFPKTPGLKLLLEIFSYFASWEIVAIISLVLLAFEDSREKLGNPAAIVASSIFIFTKVLDYYMIKNGFTGFITTEAAFLVGFYGILGYLVKNYNWKEKSLIYDAFLFCMVIIVSISILYMEAIELSVFIAGLFIGLFILFFGIGKMKILGIIKK